MAKMHVSMRFRLDREKNEIKNIYNFLLGSFKLLYVTPERLAKSKRFMNALQKCYTAKRLHLIAIDEGGF